MPNLLSLNSYHYRRGGSDAVYFDHAKLFEKIGWQNGFFSMHHPRNEDTEWNKYFIDELEFGSDYSLGQKISMAGKVIYSFEAQRKLRQLLKHFNADIAHIHCIYHHLSPSVLPVLKQEGIPVVLTAHDLKLACPAYKMMNSNGVCESCQSGNYLNLVINRCIHGSTLVSGVVMLEAYVNRLLGSYRKNLSKIVAPSNFFKTKLIEWGWPEQLISTVPNFIHLNDYRPSYQPGNYALFFGRLAPEKGVDTLIKACAKSKTKLLIAGTGPDEEKLKSLATTLKADVEFKGFCKGKALHALVQGSRGVVLPSQWYENAPISILEAYAFGKTVIGADIGGIPEMIIDGQTGKLFESGNVDQLAEALSALFESEDRVLQDQGEFARRYVEKNYNKELYLERMLNVYSSLGVKYA